MTADANIRRVAAGVVILAAGASARMKKPKLLLPWGATSVLGHLLEQWRGLPVDQIAVVCASGDGPLSQELDRLDFPRPERVVNPTPDLGMFSSIRCAARWSGWKTNLTHWIIVLGDQPHLELETLRTLMEFGVAHRQKLCQPSRGGRPRHPVWMPRQAFQQLPNASEENLKQFLQNRSPDLELCALADPGLDFDMDTPADYERALQLHFNRGSAAP
ncbi:MAG: nucleotidyltransferase family protein [Limisphaerales bacterium]